MADIVGTNGLFPKGKEALLNGTANWGSSVIRAMLVRSSPTAIDSTFQFWTSIPSGQIASTAGRGNGIALVNKQVPLGVADADDITFTAVPSGAAIQYVILYRDSGTDATSDLILWIGVASGGLPVTPNGGDISVIWDGGANRIFSI